MFSTLYLGLIRRGSVPFFFLKINIGLNGNGGKMAVIQYEKAYTLQIISICRQGQNGITKVFFTRVGGQLFQGFDLHSEEDFPQRKIVLH